MGRDVIEATQVAEAWTRSATSQTASRLTVLVPVLNVPEACVFVGPQVEPTGQGAVPVLELVMGCRIEL